MCFSYASAPCFQNSGDIYKSFFSKNLTIKFKLFPLQILLYYNILGHGSKIRHFAASKMQLKWHKMRRYCHKVVRSKKFGENLKKFQDFFLEKNYKNFHDFCAKNFIKTYCRKNQPF